MEVLNPKTKGWFLAPLSALDSRGVLFKHCQRHNGPEGWVHPTKVTWWVISQVQTQILIKFLLHNLDQALTSKSQPNISISSQTNCREISDRVSESVSDKGSQCRQLNQLFSNVENLFTIQILPELHLQNLNKTSASRPKRIVGKLVTEWVSQQWGAMSTA